MNDVGENLSSLNTMIQIPESQTIYKLEHELQTEKYYVDGWIILSFCLAIGLIIFLILWIFCMNTLHKQICTTCFGPFGVQTGVDANVLNICGTNQSSPCIFAKNSLQDCETECNNLPSICNAFTFNFSAATMRIVSPNNTFISPGTNLFVRQQGLI